MGYALSKVEEIAKEREDDEEPIETGGTKGNVRQIRAIFFKEDKKDTSA